MLMIFGNYDQPLLMIIMLRIIYKYANDHYADDYYADDHYADDNYADDHYAGNNADDL